MGVCVSMGVCMVAVYVGDMGVCGCVWECLCGGYGCARVSGGVCGGSVYVGDMGVCGCVWGVCGSVCVWGMGVWVSVGGCGCLGRCVEG